MLTIGFLSAVARQGMSRQTGSLPAISPVLDEFPQEDGTNEIVLVLAPTVSSETLSYLASVTDTITHVTQKNESLASISRITLGQVNPYVHTLAFLNDDLIGNSAASPRNIWSPLPAGTIVHLPEFSMLSRDVITSVSSGTTITELAAPFYGDVGPMTLRRIASANPSIKSLDFVPAGATVVLPTVNSVQVLRLSKGANSIDVLNKVQLMPGVEFASQNVRGRLEDPVSINQNVLASTGSTFDTDHLDPKWFAASIGADKIRNEDLKLNDNVIVAVLDSGLDFSHPGFAHNIWNNPLQDSSGLDEMRMGEHGFDFANRRDTPDDTLANSHGTHVAGIASARALVDWFTSFKSSNIDQHIKLMILKVCDDKGNVSLESVMSALEYAQANGARIVSGSWSTVGSDPLRTYLAQYPGILMVIAAGNGLEKQIQGNKIPVGQDIDANPSYPASFKLKNMITVGAFDPIASRAFFSNFGSGTVGVLAPGVEIRSTARVSTSVAGDAYENLSGTSQATPFVTLAAALLLAKRSLMSVQAVKRRILDTGELDTQMVKVASGGRLNLLKAISVDQDLMELNDQTRTNVRGRFMSHDFRFVESSNDCSGARTFNDVRDQIARIFVKFDGSNSLVEFHDRRAIGTLCESRIAFDAGQGEKNWDVQVIRDLIWRGVGGRSLD
jgi:subtilisin family serine protease